VGPIAGLDTEDRGKILLSLLGIELRSPGRPVRSQTLYCLGYPGSHVLISSGTVYRHVPANFENCVYRTYDKIIRHLKIFIFV
jgi:hypothetical protein